MRTKQKAALLVEQRLVRDRAEAYHDARALAIELARGEPPTPFDPMAAGVVLQPGETVYRQVPLWIRVQQDGTWADASFADVIVTDLRLLCRFSSGRLVSLWWSGVVGLHVELTAEYLVLDYGDGQPVSLSGSRVAVSAVVVITRIYSVAALLAHPALAPLRNNGPERSQTDGLPGPPMRPQPRSR
ncbi:MAG: hypothetical protein ACYDDU_20510 [Dermatophilaceae bacterium]